MLTQSFDKKFLLGSTVIAGFAALTVISGPAHAQSTASDTTAATTAVQQQSPEQGAPPEARPTPRSSTPPDNPDGSAQLTKASPRRTTHRSRGGGRHRLADPP
jgi:hypothetical protein